MAACSLAAVADGRAETAPVGSADGPFSHARDNASVLLIVSLNCSAIPVGIRR